MGATLSQPQEVSHNGWMNPRVTGVSHISVLAQEALALLAIRSAGTYVDGTVGGGGHAARLLAQLGSDGRLLGFDEDPQAVAACQARLGADPRVRLAQGNFAELPALLDAAGVDAVDGVLLDVGVSSLQLDAPERGFSFQMEGPLDMRKDPARPHSAADLVNTASETDLARWFRDLGDERYARRIARTIVRRRAQDTFTTTTDLAACVASAVPGRWRIHPATRVFQALRIVVNDELDTLQAGLQGAHDRLAPEGRLVVIAFHSGEDRIVKRFLRDKAGRCSCPPDLPVCVCGAQATMRVLTRRPVRPGADEIADNPRARSARLRAGERLRLSEAA